MPLLRITPAGSRALTPSVRPFSSSCCIRSVQGYGDGKGDPKGENPQSQGSSSKTNQNAEHPGPAAPTEGQGTGGATKATDKHDKPKDPADASAQSGGSRSKEAKESGSSPTAGSVGGKRSFSTSAWRRAKEEGDEEHSKPKIHGVDMDVKESQSEDKKKEVEQHNKEFEEGHDRAAKVKDDKVHEKFWSGQGGKHRDP